MKKQTKIAAVLSAAAFMAMVSGLPVYAASHGWVTEGDAKVYYDEDGYLTTDAWRKRGDDWFYLGEDGQIVKNAKIDEYYVDEEGKMVTSAWVELKNEEDPDSPETLVLGEPRENGFMEAILTKTGEGEYDLVVNSKAPFPYIRSAVFPLLIPVTAPAAADSIVINFNAQVGEAVVFAPDKWSIVRSKLEEAGSRIQGSGRCRFREDQASTGNRTAHHRDAEVIRLLRRNRNRPTPRGESLLPHQNQCGGVESRA